MINLHHDKLGKCCASVPFLALPEFPEFPALSFIPRKHLRYRAVLMRTEWTDPRPPRRWGPPRSQIHRRYQFSSVLFKRPDVESQTRSALCSTGPTHIPQKLPLALSAVKEQEFFLYMSKQEIFKMPVSEECVDRFIVGLLGLMGILQECVNMCIICENNIGEMIIALFIL